MTGLGLVARSLANQAFVEHFRCPDDYAEFEVLEPMSAEPGFYRLGPDIVCFSRSAAGSRTEGVTDPLYDALHDLTRNWEAIPLPFTPSDVISGLRGEQYSVRITRVPSVINEA